MTGADLGLIVFAAFLLLSAWQVKRDTLERERREQAEKLEKKWRP